MARPACAGLDPAELIARDIYSINKNQIASATVAVFLWRARQASRDPAACPP